MNKFNLILLSSAALFISGCGGGGSDSSSGGNTGGGSVVEYTVTASVSTGSDGGSVSPSERKVRAGNTTTFTINPNENFEIDRVSGCNGTLGNNNTYTTGSINGNCSVNVRFKSVLISSAKFCFDEYCENDEPTLFKSRQGLDLTAHYQIMDNSKPTFSYQLGDEFGEIKEIVASVDGQSVDAKVNGSDMEFDFMDVVNRVVGFRPISFSVSIFNDRGERSNLNYLVAMVPPDRLGQYGKRLTPLHKYYFVKIGSQFSIDVDILNSKSLSHIDNDNLELEINRVRALGFEHVVNFIDVSNNGNRITVDVSPEMNLGAAVDVEIQYSIRNNETGEVVANGFDDLKIKIYGIEEYDEILASVSDGYFKNVGYFGADLQLVNLIDMFDLSLRANNITPLYRKSELRDIKSKMYSSTANGLNNLGQALFGETWVQSELFVGRLDDRSNLTSLFEGLIFDFLYIGYSGNYLLFRDNCYIGNEIEPTQCIDFINSGVFSRDQVQYLTIQETVDLLNQHINYFNEEMGYNFGLLDINSFFNRPFEVNNNIYTFLYDEGIYGDFNEDGNWVFYPEYSYLNGAVKNSVDFVLNFVK